MMKQVGRNEDKNFPLIKLVNSLKLVLELFPSEVETKWSNLGYWL